MLPSRALVYDHSVVWETPLDLDGTTPRKLFAPKSATTIAVVAYFFFKGLDCKVSEWKTMNVCDHTCGGGVLEEMRLIERKPSHGGVPCPVVMKRKINCNDDPCPVDCEVSKWMQTGPCTMSCGGGTVEETRQILKFAELGGKDCPTQLKRVTSCNQQPCDGVDCQVTPWIDSGICSKTCGKGTQKQFRRIVRHSEYGGVSCSDYSLTRTLVCNPVPCQRLPFDPMAAGRLTKFDFDIAEYCDSPAQCATAEDIESLSEVPVQMFQQVLTDMSDNFSARPVFWTKAIAIFVSVLSTFLVL